MKNSFVQLISIVNHQNADGNLVYLDISPITHGFEYQLVEIGLLLRTCGSKHHSTGYSYA